MVNDDPDQHVGPGPSDSPGSRGPRQRLRLVGADVYADWDEIYLDNVVRIYRLMYSKVANRPDAEDLTAEVFLAALRPMRIGASRGEIRVYLAATARTVLAGFWRRRLGVEMTRIEPNPQLADIETASEPTAAPERARRILNSLPERYRHILDLRFLQAMSLKEAAHEMHVTVANAKVLQHRALRQAAEDHRGEP